MKHSALTTALLASLLLVSPASRLQAGEDGSPAPQPGEKKKIVIASPEREIVVDENGVYLSGDDDDGILLADLPDFGGSPGVLPLHGGGYVGVRPIGMTPELRQHFGAPRDFGVLVGSVEAESPAAKAGLEVGDIITAVGGEPIGSPRELSREVRRRAGETLRFEIVRNRVAKTLPVTVGTRKPEEIELGELGPMPRFHFEGPGHHGGRIILPPPGLGALEDRLEELEKRLRELEDRLPAR